MKILTIPRVQLYFKFKELFLLFIRTVFCRLSYKKLFDKFNNILISETGSTHILPTTSAGCALHVILSTLNLPPGSEIIMSPITVEGIIQVILAHKLKIVFVDVNENNYLSNIFEVKKKINNKTRAILITPLFGWYGDMEEFRNLSDEYNLYLIEDCAQAFGCSYNEKYAGTYGDFALYSFGPVKFPTGMSGGAIAYKDKKWTQELLFNINKCKKPGRFRLIKEIIRYSIIWVSLSRPVFHFITFKLINMGLKISIYLKHFSFTSKVLSSIINPVDSDYCKMGIFSKKDFFSLYEQPNYPQMAMLLSQLEYYKSVFQKRKDNANELHLILYPSLKGKVNDPVKDGETHFYWQFPLRASDKIHFIQFLNNYRIDVSGLVFLRSYNRDVFGENAEIIPVADTVSKEIVYIPIFPILKKHEIKYIAKSIIKYFKQNQ